jgi:hypothetical protein
MLTSGRKIKMASSSFYLPSMLLNEPNGKINKKNDIDINDIFNNS